MRPRIIELLLGFRPGSLLFLRGRLFRCLLFGGGFLFRFRGNRPSTPSAGNSAHNFARSCRKLDLSERVFGAFLAQINDVSSCVRIVQQFRAVENEAQRWDLIAEEANSPMDQYAWVKACTDAFATCGELQLIVVGAEQPRALGPFIMRSGPLNRMECLGVA